MGRGKTIKEINKFDAEDIKIAVHKCASIFEIVDSLNTYKLEQMLSYLDTITKERLEKYQK